MKNTMNMKKSNFVEGKMNVLSIFFIHRKKHLSMLLLRIPPTWEIRKTRREKTRNDNEKKAETDWKQS
jgi:hypothetical protein